MSNWRIACLLCLFFSTASISIAQHKKDSLSSVGLALYADKEYIRAANVFDLVVRDEQVQGEDFFNAARMWAMASDADRAFEYLKLAFSYGFMDLEATQKSEDLKAVRRTERFRKLMAQERAFQSDSIISMADVVRALIDRNVVILENKRFVSDIQPWYDPTPAVEELMRQANDERVNLTPEGLIDFRSKSLVIKNGRGPIHLNGLALKSLEIRNSNDLSVYENMPISKMEVVQLANLNLASFAFSLNGQSFVRFFFVKAFHVAEYNLKNINRLTISKSELEINTHYRSSFEYVLSGSFGTKDYPLNEAVIDNTLFRKNDGEETTMTVLRFFTNVLFLEHCTFENEVSFETSEVKTVNWPRNQFLKPVDLSKVDFEMNGLLMPFSQFESGLGVKDMVRPWEIAKDKLLITGDLDEAKDAKAFSMLISSHKFLLENYDKNGDKESGREVFLKIKRLHLVKDRQLLNENPSITRFLDFQINKLSGLVSNHGTSTGKVIVLSFLSILFFAVMYAILDNSTKSDSQSARPKTIATRISSALMMSVMAQITLRSSKGASTGIKWLCVFQGLIGWTLFSFFIIALFHQASV